jgi:hypothetical protein
VYLGYLQCVVEDFAGNSKFDKGYHQVDETVTDTMMVKDAFTGTWSHLYIYRYVYFCVYLYLSIYMYVCMYIYIYIYLLKATRGSQSSGTGGSLPLDGVWSMNVVQASDSPGIYIYIHI